MNCSSFVFKSGTQITINKIAVLQMRKINSYVTILIWCVVFLSCSMINSIAFGQAASKKFSARFVSENDNKLINEWNRNMSIGFTENKGQILNTKNEIAENVFFKLTVPGMDVYVTNEGLRYVFLKAEEKKEKEKTDQGKVFGGREPRKTKISVIDMHLEGAKIEKENIIVDQLLETGRVDHYSGHVPDGIIDIKTYQKIIFTNVYPQIDWVLYVKPSGDKNTDVIKQDFIVHPGADPKTLRLLYNGAGTLEIENKKSIHIFTSLGNLHEGELVCYEEQTNNIIPAAYEMRSLENDSYNGCFSKKVTVEVGSYDPAKTLVIDPALNWLTYYAGNFLDGFNAVSVDSRGDIIVCGYTGSSNYPVLNMGGAYFDNSLIYMDMTILKFSNTGQRLWATFYGGNNPAFGTEWAEDVEIDSNDNIFIIGTSNCTDLPTQTAGGVSYFEPASTAGGTGFVLKFSTSGVRQWATYLKGTGYAYSGHIDKNNNLYVVGGTSDNSLPNVAISGSSYVQAFSALNGYDSFIMKFDPSLQLVWSTYFGGDQTDMANNIISNSNGNIFVTGQTRSANMPLLNKGGGAYYQAVKASPAGTSTSYLNEFSGSGQLLWSTFLGGTGLSEGFALAINRSDHLFVIGETRNSDFPTLNPGAGAYFDNVVGSAGGTDVFISEFDTAGVMRWSTLFGGSGGDGNGTGLMGATIDSCDNLYITGQGHSVGFPYFNAGCGSFYANDRNGTFIARFNVNRVFNWGVSLRTAGWGEDLATDADGNLFVIGEYTAAGGVVNDPGGGAYYDSTWQGGGTGDDAFIGKFTPVLPTVAQSQTNSAACSCNGTATISMTCGIAPYNYVWSNGSQSLLSNSTASTITGLCPGIYSVTVTDAACSPNGASSTFTIVGTGNSMSLNPSQTAAACNVPSGTASVAPSGGTAPYTYSWSTLATSAGISNLLSGIYSVTVTDSTGCSQSTGITVNNVPGVTAQLSSMTPASCFNSCNGAAAINGSGGTSPYAFLWSGGYSTDSLINLCSGTYTATITDAAGCFSLINVIITEPSPLSALTSSLSVACNGDSTGLASVTMGGGTAPYFYSWSNNQTTSQVSLLTSQTYSVTITDALGCTTGTIISITEPTALSVSTSTTSANCNMSAGTASVSVSGGVGPYAYLWSSVGSTQSSISNLTSGTYSVIVTDNNGCTQTTSITVGNFPGVTAQLNSTTAASCFSLCNGSATIGGTGGTTPYSYNWSNGSTVDTPTNLCSGVHTATVTDGAGCYSLVNITITQPSVLSVVGNQLSVNCFGDSTGMVGVNVSGGTSPYAYLWNSAIGTSVNQQINNLPAGTYSVTITDNNNCSIDTVFTITQPPAFSYSLSVSNESCQQQNGSVTLHLSGGAPGYSYFWSVFGNDSVIGNLSAGSYTVYAQDNNGCIMQADTTINNLGTAYSNTVQPNLCAGSNYTLPDGSVVSASGTYSHTLTSVLGCDSIINTMLSIGSPINISQNPQICFGTSFTLPLGGVVNVGGTYKDTLTALGGCDSIITTDLTVFPVYSATANPSICAGGSYTLPGGSSVNTTGVYSNTLITVDGCDSIIVTNLSVNNAAIYNQMLAPACDSLLFKGLVFRVSGLVNDTIPNGSANGCDSITITQITINPTTNNSITRNSCNSYTHNGQTYFSSGVYTQTLTSVSNCDSMLTIQLTIGNIAIGNASVTGCDSVMVSGSVFRVSGWVSDTIVNGSIQGCDSITITNFTVYPLPILTVSNDTAIQSGNAVTLTASASGGGGISYSWSTGESSSSINQQPIANNSYIVTIADTNGCIISDTINVTVKTECDDSTKILVPNSFSPNNDGQNDLLKLYSNGIKEIIYFAIFNRWGEIVFETEDINAIWDGAFRNKPCDTGVYVYLLKYDCSTSTEEVIKRGNISLVR